jgi:hypothetical protein
MKLRKRLQNQTSKAAIPTAQYFEGGSDGSVSHAAKIFLILFGMLRNY